MQENVYKPKKIRIIKIIGTITEKYGFGVYSIRIDKDYNQFDKNNF